MKVAVIGAAGLIGQERIKALTELNKLGAEISVLAFDTDTQKLVHQASSNKSINVVGYNLETILKNVAKLGIYCHKN